MTSGWEKKVFTLRTVVLVSHHLAKELSPNHRRTFEIMRELRRLYSIGEASFTTEHRARFDALGAEVDSLHGEAPQIIYEPAKIRGWLLHAGMYLVDGKHWWIVGASRNARTFTERDRSVLAKALDTLGGHIEHSALSSLPLDELIAEGVKFTWTWINQGGLLDMHLRNRGTKTGKDDLRIVPRGVAPSDGFEKIEPGEET